MQIRIWITVFFIIIIRSFSSGENFSKDSGSYPNKTDTSQAVWQPSGVDLKSKKSVQPQSTSTTLKPAAEPSLDMTHEVTVNYPTRPKGHVQSFRVPREDTSRAYTYRKTKGKKVQPGQFASKTSPKRRNNWKLWPEHEKNAMIPSDSKIAWSYWEADESEEPDDADDSMMQAWPTTKATTKATTTTAATTTTTTTTTTAAPPPMTTKGPKAPVTIYKHFHYFKKAAPWKGDAGMPMTMPMPMPMPMPTPMPMSMEEMMKMTEDMMEDMMMKNMMMKSMMMPAPEMEKKGLSGFWDKLSKVEPITVLVAGIIPASLILAAALPSVMTKMMWMKGEMNGNGGPTMSTITTTAMGPGMDMTGTRYRSSDSISSFIEAASEFGFKALEKPQCARQMFCRLAKNTIMTDSPALQRAIQVATVAMENSWLDHLGVQDIFRSLTEGTCNDDDCESTPRNIDS